MAEDKFVRINIKDSVKNEIDIIAKVERRPVYEVVKQMVDLYKAVSYGRNSKKIRKIESVALSDIVARQEG